MRFAVLLLVVMAFIAPTSAQTLTCTVPENYLEALRENQDGLLRVTVLLNTGGGALNNLDTAEVNYEMLRSIRRYHEDAHATLPDCAQPANRDTIAAISAAQDAFALLFIREVNADQYALYADDLAAANEALRERFSTMNATIGAAQFTV